jgi:hypothetical protein
MIPHKILKKIRQIELHANRIVTETLAGFSFQPAPQFRRIPRAVENRNDNQLSRIFKQREVDGIRPVEHFYFLGGWPGKWKSLRVFGSFVKSCASLAGKFLTDAVRLRIIPSNRLIQFRFGLVLEDDPKRHCLARYRFSMSAKTSSIGRQRSGCARALAARRSSSAICSDVSSSSNRLRSCSKTFRCSSNGSLSTCSKTWAALMVAIYSFDSIAQAGVFVGLNSAIGNRQSAIFP